MKLPKFYRSGSVYYRIYLLTLTPTLIVLGAFLLYLWLGTDQGGLAVTGLGVLLLGLALTMLLARSRVRRLLQPITTVNRAMQRIRDGELNTRIEVVAPGEMGELEAGFNAMAQEIAAGQELLQDRIEQATREARESMEVIEIRNAELDLARRRAIQAGRAKAEFLANMSHEIRTPMNGIVGFTHLLAKTELTEKQRDFLTTLQKSATSLLRIVDDILDFSQLESGKLVLGHDPFSLRECMESAVTLWAPQAHAKHLELVSMVYSDVPDRMVGDETRIIQILNNLLGNAVKFTETGEVVGRVMLEGEDEHSVTVTFAVSDTGIGIPLAEQQRLFQAFDQGSATTKRLFGGTGLGLSICRALAEAMHGQIHVTSRPGEGSVFRVTLRLDLEPDAAPQRQVPPLNRRGLLIEPHDLSRIALRNAFTDMGLAIDDHAGFAELDVIDPQRYSLVAIGCEGVGRRIAECLEQTRRFSAQYGLPVIALVSTSDPELLARFSSSGASYCLSKPATRRNLQESLRGCLRAGKIARISAPAADANASSVPLIDRQKLLDGKRCLAADDHAINLRLITHLLSDMGAEVLQAGDGDEAVQLTMENDIDMAFLDIHMPRMNGLEAARRIRALNPDHPVPIIALTADAAEKNQREIARAGIQRYLIKPVNEDDLRRVVGELLTGKVEAKFTKATTGDISTHTWPVRDRAQALRIAGGSEGIAAKLFAELRAELPATLSSLRSEFDKRDWSELWQLSHRLHGAAAVCGVPALYHALAELQPAITLEDESAVSILLERVAQETLRIIEMDD